MVSGQEVLRVVETKGPILPIHIKKEVGSDTITIGAVLSELSQAGKVKISHTKIGGSPTYYIDSQKAKLQDLYKYLNDKQQKAFDSLKSNKVLRDNKQAPVIRLALRHIKDFAKPLEVKAKDGKEIFWKWYLTPNDEAEVIIRKQLKLTSPKTEKKVVKKEDKKQEKKTAPKKARDGGELMGRIKRFFSRKNIEIIEENVIRKNSEIDFVISVPGQLGKQTYYCKAKNKKKCNDGDLSSAFIKGQRKNLPIIFLTTGEITKNAETMLDDEFKGMMVKSI